MQSTEEEVPRQGTQRKRRLVAKSNDACKKEEEKQTQLAEQRKSDRNINDSSRKDEGKSGQQTERRKSDRNVNDCSRKDEGKSGQQTEQRKSDRNVNDSTSRKDEGKSGQQTERRKSDRNAANSSGKMDEKGKNKADTRKSGLLSKNIKSEEKPRRPADRRKFAIVHSNDSSINLQDMPGKKAEGKQSSVKSPNATKQIEEKNRQSYKKSDIACEKTKMFSKNVQKNVNSSSKKNEKDITMPRKLASRKPRSKENIEKKVIINRVGNNAPGQGEEDLDFSAIEQKIFEGFSDADRHGKKPILKVKSSVQKPNNQRKSVNRSGKGSPMESSKSPKLSKDTKSKRESVNKKETVKKNRRIKVEVTDRKKRKGVPGKVAGSDSEASDWEEVDEMDGVDEVTQLLGGPKSDVAADEAQQGVKIELDAPDVMWGMRKRKRRTEEELIEDYLRKSVNRSIKEQYENMHKTHLLCLFAYGRHVNQTLNSEVLLGCALSLITDKNAYPPKRLDIDYLQKFLNWFSRKIKKSQDTGKDEVGKMPLQERLAARFESKTASSNQELVFMFVAVCRALGMNVRLVLAHQPMSWKPRAALLMKPAKKEDQKSSSPAPSPCTSQGKKNPEVVQVPPYSKKKHKNSRKMLSSDSEETPERKCFNSGKKRSSSSSSSKLQEVSEDEWDSDFEPSQVKRGPKKLPAQRRGKFSEKRKFTEEDARKEAEGVNERKKRKAEGLVEWAEVYVEEEERWMCIDVVHKKLHCVPEIEAKLPPGSAYITSFNSNLTVKDVTKRYVSSWLSSENKIRCCSKWWADSLKPFRGVRSRLDKEEDQELNQNLRQQPLPKSIAEYKNHPLYALQRHLLKFEAMYPPDASPVGFIKGEPVYPRECVYTLCSRDTWIKEAKTVKVGEEPYKIVKARPKWDKNSCQIVKDRPLEVFGEWQVEDYEPPVASGGKVPRSEYGTVELFKPTMLPRGCVHIPIAGINRVARKLHIDCAPAMIGFDYHSGWSHPVYDGYVVCEEFKDVIMDAWQQEKEEQARREEEKRQKRIYGNWKRLIQGMMVKARVREKYGDGTQSEDEPCTEEDQHTTSKDQPKKPTKRKIKQEDIDSLRPENASDDSRRPEAVTRTGEQEGSRLPIITHQVPNLKIDLSSNVVEMAKKSRQRTMKTKSNTRKVAVQQIKKPNAVTSSSKVKGEELSSESEVDEEVKKERIRAILNWGSRAVVSNPDLSDDDSGGEGKSLVSSACPPQSHPLYGELRKKFTTHRGKKKKNEKNESELSEVDSSGSEECETSASTTPEPELVDGGGHARSARVTRGKVKTYQESEEQSEGHLSLSDSDCEDKTYNPFKK